MDEYRLPPAPGKASDSRAASFAARHGRLVRVELEALPPEVLRVLLTTALDRIVDTSTIEAIREREERERRQLAKLARSW